MELPNYRLPAAKSVARLVWDKAKGFIKKAFTVVLAACVIIWFLQTFDAHLNVVEDVDTSLLACIGGFIAPLFAPLGYGDWRVHRHALRPSLQSAANKAALVQHSK